MIEVQVVRMQVNSREYLSNTLRSQNLASYTGYALNFLRGWQTSDRHRCFGTLPPDNLRTCFATSDFYYQSHIVLSCLKDYVPNPTSYSNTC